MPIINLDDTLRTARKPPITVKIERDKRQRLELADRIKSAKWHKGLAHKIIAALPIVSVNIVAVTFQLTWAHTALASWGNYGAILYAVSVETVALSVSFHAHLATVRNLRSGGLNLASILIGSLVGVLNASHWIHHSIALAIVAYGCSFASPLLWHMYSTAVSSALLVKTGHLDYAPIHLGWDRIMYHPIRSFQVKSASAWSGERNIHRAIATYDKKIRDKAINRAAEKSKASIEESAASL